MADLSKLPQPAISCFPGSVATTDTEGRAAFVLRFGTATKDAARTGSVAHNTNNDLTEFPNGLGSYSKGLVQDSPGYVNPVCFEQFLQACGIKPGGPLGDFEHPAIKRGGARKLNGPRGAFALQTVGEDSAAYGYPLVPPAPALDSIAYAIELVEMYWASLLRDVPFMQYHTHPTANAAADELSALVAAYPGQYAGPLEAGKVTPQVLFRGGLNANPGYFEGETKGPYLSQFCLVPTSLGRLPLDQKIRTFLPGQDFMTTLSVWGAIQNGATPIETALFDEVLRYMRNGRDTAAYTQSDELYQAYFVAYLVANTLSIMANPGSPYFGYVNDQAFGTFGGPDIASTLGAVARAAIDAVWYQKWRVHLRHRPESGGGIVQLWNTGGLNPADKAKLASFEIVLKSEALKRSFARHGSYLLSQAFPEGSPTHPAYPTGHGAVAGACITVLKFFLNGNAPFTTRLVPSTNGLTLEADTGPDALTVNGELHKLAHNVSFGHGIHAGIYWRSDTDYSILLGEAVAIDFLMDQIFSYQENFDIAITKVDGTVHHFKNF